MIEIVITGLCAGFGSAIGNYFATNHVLKYIAKVNKYDGIDKGK
jgi:hypothetical protein